ncbi:MAG: EAL domain-containing protein [Wolinella sp.]
MNKQDAPLSRLALRYIAILFLTALMGIASIVSIVELNNERKESAKLFYTEQMRDASQRFELLLQYELQTYTLFVASMATHEKLIKSLKNSDRELAREFVKNALEASRIYKTNGDIWIQLIDSNLKAFYRSWSPRHGDSMEHVRPELYGLLHTPMPLTQLGMGIYTVSLRHTYPVKSGDEVLGFVEVIVPIQEMMKQFSRETSIESALIISAKQATQITQRSYSMLNDHFALLYSTSSSTNGAFSGMPKTLPCDTISTWKHDGKILGATCLKDNSGKLLGSIVFLLPEQDLNIKLEANLAPLSKLIIILTLASGLLLLLFLGYARSAHAGYLSMQKLYDRLTEESSTNSLTHLPNRRAIRIDMQQDMTCSYLILLNINSFRTLNDFYGSDFGDDVLLEFAARLRILEKKYAGMRAYHLQADEFALLYPGKRDLNRIIEIVLRFMTQHPYSQNRYHTEIALGISIGATKCSQQALEQADVALNFAKQSSENYKIYAPELENHQELHQHIFLTKKLKEALKDDRIVPFFQPIVDCKGNIKKYECLARIIQENGEILPPAAFLQIAKKSKLYSKLTQRIIQKSFQAFENLDYQFSINLSFEDISTPRTCDFIVKALHRYSGRERVIFEIIETDDIKSYKAMEEFICNVKKYGARVAIDDFGSGYSNFLNITKLKVDFIKIDGSLIQGLGRDKNTEVIVRAISGISQTLGIETIAEFVDSEALSQKVISLGIDYQQGYHFYKPSPQII